MASRKSVPGADAAALHPFSRNQHGPAYAAFQTMRDLCARRNSAMLMDDKSPYAHEFIAAGGESAVFKYFSRKAPELRFAVKFNKGTSWTETAKALADIRGLEIEATFIAWYILAARGLSSHVPQLFGVLPFSCRSALPYTSASPSLRLKGLMIEYMTGLPMKDGSTAKDVDHLVRAGRQGLLVGPGGEDILGDVLPVVLFQVLFTVAMWTAATANGFRHNDLHSGNVCLTYWNTDRTPVDLEYHLPDADGIDRVFVLRTPVCATVVDFGYASLRPAVGGAPFDPRFYTVNRVPEALKSSTKTANRLHESKFVAYGMSHCVPSRHYDSSLFMFAVRQLFGKVIAHPAGVQFREMYQRCLHGVHMSRHMFKGDACGRLTPDAQASLMRPAMKLVINRKDAVMQDARGILMDPYFRHLRGAASPERRLVFGLCASEAALPPQVTCNDIPHGQFSMGGRPEDASWSATLTHGGKVANLPRPAPWIILSQKLDALKEETPPGRRMTAEEAREWVSRHPGVCPDLESEDDAAFDFEAAKPTHDM